MTSSIVFDLVARDKSIESTFNKDARAAEDFAKSVDRSAKQMNSAFNATAKQISSDLDRIERDAWGSGKDMGREFMRSLSNIREGLDKVRAEAGRTGAGLESDLGGALRDIKRDMDRLGDEAKKTGNEVEAALSEAGKEGGSSFGDALTGQLGGGFDLGGMIESLTGGAGGGIAAAGAGLGGALAAAEWEAFNAYFDQRSLGGVIAAQQGASTAAAGKLGRVAGNAYYTGFADSVEEGGAALSGVLSQGLIDTDASQADIQELTNLAATAATVVGDSANDVARDVNQLITNHLVPDAQAGFDLVVAASQRGVNAAGDMSDTIEEYSVQFARMGLSGQESLGLISQAMAAGARNSDIAADAIKEFAIRAVDGTAGTARGFRTIGLDAGVMGERIAAGGSVARDALDQTLDGLRAIEDPVKRNQAAVDLFGTKAEDLGQALYAMDLDTVSTQFGDVAGAAEGAGQVINDSISPIDKLGRGIEAATNVAIGGFAALAGGAEETETHIAKTSGKVIDFRSESEKLSDAQNAARDAIESINTSASAYARTLEEIITAEEQLANDYADSEHAQINYQAAIDAANQSLKDNKQNTDISTEAGRANKEALLDVSDSAWKVAAAMENQGATAQQVQGFMESARAQFVQTAISMGYGAAEANAMADKLHLIPGEYNARVRADTAGANNNIDVTLLKLRALSQIYTASVQIKTSGGGILSQLGIIPHRASGGSVDMGNAYMVGEEGPELYVPDQNGTIIPNDMITQSAAAFRPSFAGRSRDGGGGSAATVVEWVGGPSDDLGRAAFDYIRDRVAIKHGGSVTAALGQRGVA